jgi:hypothetical protein
VRKRLRAWLIPTLCGPLVSTALLVTFSELFGATGFWGIARWLALLALYGTAACALSLSLLLVDWLLLLTRVRVPPTGRRGWLSGALAPLPAYGIWLLLRPSLLSAPSTHALAAAAAILGAAVAVRLLTSPRSTGRLRFI